MEESSAYQAILEEGKARGFRKAILWIGSHRWGEPDADSRTTLEGLTSKESIEKALDQAGRWQEGG